MLRAVHARMARAALVWTIRDLEERTGINKNTLVRFESGKGVLLSTAEKIEEAFLNAGITFVYESDASGPGVVLAKTLSSDVERSRKTRRRKKK